MRKVIVLTLFVLLLVACNQDENGVEETGAATPTTAAAAPPRVEATPTPTLPATFTPPPFTHGGHIFPVGTSSIHIIQRGDTLGELAKQYGVTVADLASANRIINVDRIEEGMVLYIPQRD